MTEQIPNLKSQIPNERMEEQLRQAYATFALAGGIGTLIMADLDRTFGGNPFVAGEPDTTARNCGCLSVVEHLYRRIEEAQRPPEPQGETSDGDSDQR